MHNSRPLPLGRQLREARVRARLKPKDLARKAGVSLAALYNCERADRGGRTKTLIALALALGLSLRIPDLPALSAEQGLREAKLAEISGLPSALSDQPLRAQTVAT